MDKTAKQFLIAHSGLQESTIDNSFKWVVAAMEAWELKVADKAFTAGCEHEYEKHFGAVPPLSPNKEQYLQSLNRH